MENFPMENLELPEESASKSRKNIEQSSSPEAMAEYYYQFDIVPPHAPDPDEYITTRRLFIVAESREKALEWGRKLSDEYIRMTRQSTEDLHVAKVSDKIMSEEELSKAGPRNLEVFHRLASTVRYGEVIDLRKVFDEG